MNHQFPFLEIEKMVVLNDKDAAGIRQIVRLVEFNLSQRVRFTHL